VHRMVGVTLSSLLVLGLAAVATSQALGPRTGTAAPPGPSTALPQPVTVTALIGTEKRNYFSDPKVKQRLAELGFVLEIDTAASRDMANSRDLKKYDLAFPSSAPVAEKIIRATKPAGVSSPFYSPIAVATFQPIVDALRPVGVSRANIMGYKSLEVDRYLEFVRKNTRWDQLPGNTTYRARKAMLVSTNDVRSSGAAAMYLAITSYVANGEKVVRNGKEVAAVMPTMEQLFLGQGYAESWSEASFDDYLAQGAGKTPMLLIYESQYLELERRKDGSIVPGMVLMYPTPDVLSKHTAIGLTKNGARLGEVLRDDPQLQRLAAEYGFRTNNPAVFNEVFTGSGSNPPIELSEVIDPPRYEVLESLISRLADQY
jgi:hypothetical protein